MFGIFKKFTKKTTYSYVKPVVGMLVKHHYGEDSSGTATIVKVKGKRIIADAHKPGRIERHTYIHSSIPSGGHTKEFYVREDQLHLVFPEKIFMPYA